ncbi:hypothetical protein NDU88_004042 [Pleurodeles waltl]|uniref:Uncharacterized protein n=1 Tax=Pleurodeles waltl TaxID=8319 RepID=A0AAV7W7V8_PLEWA|nr:hypothetical protein NDU88_004041 [Pleurodeles waltl]KAJ1208659.1 hypothetical protein NDU88_004042 [Pleurodeles waltl]
MDICVRGRMKLGRTSSRVVRSPACIKRGTMHLQAQTSSQQDAASMGICTRKCLKLGITSHSMGRSPAGINGGHTSSPRLHHGRTPLAWTFMPGGAENMVILCAVRDAHQLTSNRGYALPGLVSIVAGRR